MGRGQEEYKFYKNLPGRSDANKIFLMYRNLLEVLRRNHSADRKLSKYLHLSENTKICLFFPHLQILTVQSSNDICHTEQY